MMMVMNTYDKRCLPFVLVFQFNTSFACRMIEPSLPDFEVVEDLENYMVRGFGALGWR